MIRQSMERFAEKDHAAQKPTEHDPASVERFAEKVHALNDPQSRIDSGLN
jgi:hypothetical protein